MAELLDQGLLDWQYVPEKLKGPLEAYQTAMEAVKVFDTEVFVTVDGEVNGKPLRLAGSMDRILHHKDFGVVVADLKGGTDEPKYPLGVTTQVAIYSRGMRYRDNDFDGSPPFINGTPNPDMTAWRKPLWEGVSQTTGILIHCPIDPVDGKYVCNLYRLDLERGWQSLQFGHRLQAARRLSPLKELV